MQPQRLIQLQIQSSGISIISNWLHGSILRHHKNAFFASWEKRQERECGRTNFRRHYRLWSEQMGSGFFLISYYYV